MTVEATDFYRLHDAAPAAAAVDYVDEGAVSEGCDDVESHDRHQIHHGLLSHCPPSTSRDVRIRNVTTKKKLKLFSFYRKDDHDTVQ